MFRRLLPALLLGSLAWLAACAPALTPAPTATLPPPTDTPPPPTPSPVPPTATATLAPETAGDSLFPPVTDADWQRGPRDARLTIIEYGDYQ